MKKIFPIYGAMIATIALAFMIVSGCAKLEKGADPLIVRTEQVEQTALATFDLVLNTENSNRQYFKENLPAFHNFAEWLREPMPAGTNTWPRATAMIYEVQIVKATYRANRDAKPLEQALAALQSTVSQATAWITITGKK